MYSWWSSKPGASAHNPFAWPSLPAAAPPSDPFADPFEEERQRQQSIDTLRFKAFQARESTAEEQVKAQHAEIQKLRAQLEAGATLRDELGTVEGMVARAFSVMHSVQCIQCHILSAMRPSHL